MEHHQAGGRRVSQPKIIVALDYPTAAEALSLINRLTPERCRLKIGLELYIAAGPDFVRAVVQRGFSVFLDLKFHDIPNTVAQACRQAAALRVWMVTVHCHGGSEMLRAAAAAVRELKQRPLIVGVTVLTSIDPPQLAAIGVTDAIDGQVLRLAGLASDCGLDGVVAAPTEAARLRVRFPAPFRIVTPGVRLADDSVDDQRRVLTPAAAIQAGADHIVIGRPVTRAADPIAALAEIERQIEGQ